MYECNQFTRTELALGKDGIEKLKNSKIVLFGLGGVGSYIAEALARVGVGNLIIVDGDTVDITNINRQLIANINTIGKNKAELVKERISLINPLANVVAISKFVKSENDIDFIDGTVDYVIDAIDDFDAKIMIIKKAKELGLNEKDVISYNKEREKYNIDLRKLALTQIKKLGIKDENMSVMEYCTYSSKDEKGNLKFHSHRRDRTLSMNMALFLGKE